MEAARMAATGCPFDLSLKDTAIELLESAVAGNVRTSPRSHLESSDPYPVYEPEVHERVESLFEATGEARVAPLTGQRFAHVLQRLIDHAEQRIWIQAPKIEATGVKSMEQRVDSLGRRAKEGLDVRLIIDERSVVSG